MTLRILVVEDDPVQARALRDNLAFEGFDVEWAIDCESAATAARARSPDLVLLDSMLPGKTGFELFRRLQQAGRAPVIILTALGQNADTLRGLRLGVDDGVTTPFDLEELLARIHVVLRCTRGTEERVTLGGVTVDFRTRIALSGEELIHLTSQEFELLHYLVARSGRAVHRDELLREVWKYADTPTTRSVDNAIARLRKKSSRIPRT